MWQRATTMAALAGVLVFAIPAVAQRHDFDQRFVWKAASGGMAEVRMGRMAERRAVGEDARSFGRRMTEDHGRANDDLRALADRKGFRLPGEISSTDRAEMGRLVGIHGVSFDREYLRLMVSDHRKDIAEFERSLPRISDPDLRDWVRNSLSAMRDHLRMAREDWDRISRRAHRGRFWDMYR